MLSIYNLFLIKCVYIKKTVILHLQCRNQAGVPGAPAQGQACRRTQKKSLTKNEQQKLQKIKLGALIYQHRAVQRFVKVLCEKNSLNFLMNLSYCEVQHVNLYFPIIISKDIIQDSIMLLLFFRLEKIIITIYNTKSISFLNLSLSI